jgi:hypothetical protein
MDTEDIIREYLECLPMKELVEWLQPKLTKKEQDQILLELYEEHQEILNQR